MGGRPISPLPPSERYDPAREMETRGPVTVVVGQFEDLVARGLRALIEDDPNIEVVREGVAHDRIPPTLAELDPRVAILNFGSLRSPVDVHELQLAFPQSRLIVLANHPSPAECNQMLAFGATACLSKETQARDILSAIHLASRGLHVLPKTAREFGLDQPPGPDLLTPREADVLELLQQGRSNSEIAGVLHVGKETVRTHARSIYRKLGVQNRRELASLAQSRNGEFARWAAEPRTTPTALR
jgi:DNA-binding NarL/FixJ family response regulator